MHGLARHMPLTMAAFVVGGLSLIGVPLTSGFISKWYLVTAVLDSGYWPLAVLVLASTLIAIMYVWRVVEVAYFRTTGTQTREAREAPAVMLIPLWVLVGANLYFGIDSSLPTGLALQGAADLFGTPPPDQIMTGAVDAWK
jgi:multicomponent Na+:H+ antiporter subunit D